MAGILEGIKVVDMGHVVAVPAAGARPKSRPPILPKSPAAMLPESLVPILEDMSA